MVETVNVPIEEYKNLVMESELYRIEQAKAVRLDKAKEREKCREGIRFLESIHFSTVGGNQARHEACEILEKAAEELA